MKKSLGFLLGVLLPVWAAAQNLAVPVGAPLYDVYMRGLNTAPALFSGYRGKPMIINVWASYCSPCLAEMGALENVHRQLADQVNLIGISIDDYPERAFGFLDKADTSFRHYLDYQLQLESMLGADAIPLTVFVDENGVVLKKVRGAQEWDSEENLRLIQTLFEL